MKRVKLFKIFFITSTITILFISVSLVLFIHFFPKDKILDIVSSKAEETLKRKVQIKGIDYSLQGIRLSNITIYDDLSSSKKIFAHVKEANIKFLFLPLLKKKLIINHIITNNLQINIIYKRSRSNLENFVRDLTNIKEEGKSSISTKISNIILKNSEINLLNPPKNISHLKGKYLFDGFITIGNIHEFNISNIKLILPDNKGTLLSDIKISKLKDDYKISGDVKLKKIYLLWLSKGKGKEPFPYTSFSGEFKDLIITRKFTTGSFTGFLLLSDLKKMSIDGLMEIDIPLKRVRLANLGVKINDSSFLIDEMLFTLRGSLKRLNINNIGINIRDIRTIIPFISPEFYGNVSGNLTIQNKKYNGKLTFRNAGFNKKSGIIRDINETITISNNSIRKKNIKMLIFNQPCDISIATIDKKFQRLVLNIHCTQFKFPLEEKKNTEKIFSPIKIPVEVSGKIVVENLFINKLNFSNLSINYFYDNGILSLKKLNSQFSGGTLQGKGIVVLSSNTPDIDLSISFNNLKVQNIASLNKNYSNRFFGIASGKTTFNFSLENNFNIQKSIQGKIELTIKKGKLVDTGLQKGLGLWLSELKYKLRDLEFNHIYGNLNIIGQNCFINSFIFKSPDVRLLMDGHINKSFEYKMKMTLEFNENFIKDVPDPAFLMSYSLSKHKKGNWYILPFQARGADMTKKIKIKPL